MNKISNKKQGTSGNLSVKKVFLTLVGAALMFAACQKECKFKGQTKDGFYLDENNCEWIKNQEPPVDNCAELKRQEIHQFYRDSVPKGYNQPFTAYIEQTAPNPTIKDTTRCAPLAKDDYVGMGPREESKRKVNKFVNLCAEYDAFTQ